MCRRKTRVRCAASFKVLKLSCVTAWMSIPDSAAHSGRRWSTLTQSCGVVPSDISPYRDSWLRPCHASVVIINSRLRDGAEGKEGSLCLTFCRARRTMKQTNKLHTDSLRTAAGWLRYQLWKSRSASHQLTAFHNQSTSITGKEACAVGKPQVTYPSCNRSDLNERDWWFAQSPSEFRLPFQTLSVGSRPDGYLR